VFTPGDPDKLSFDNYIFGFVVSVAFTAAVSTCIAEVSGAAGATIVVSEDLTSSVLVLSLQAVKAAAAIITANNFFIANYFNGLLMGAKIY
jgi:hypothetical protein